MHFGDVEKLVHIEHDDPDATELVPAPPISRKDKLAMRERLFRLKRRLFAERHLMQYFHDDVLYRSEGARTIGPDELFLDLVIVGGIAALGHELRENFNGWLDVEKFFLLFAAIYSGWRSLVITWNLWDVRSDLIDKIGIYLAFFSLTGIALGAHGAFQDGIRPYVAVSAFVATALPSFSCLVWGLKEPLMKNPVNVVNQLTLMSTINLFSAVPYLAAAFVSTDRTTRIMYWVPYGMQTLSYVFSGSLYRYIHRNREGYSRLAIAIELMVEKYEVLTMIVLGESVLGMLFEAALVVTKEGARVGALYAAAAAGTAMLYALQTLYVNVDGHIIKGGTHAIRFKAFFGILWSQIHTVYHFSLILFATGLGIALRDITIPPKEDAAEKLLNIVLRATEESGTSTGPKFGTEERWLFSSGWGASLLLSGIIGLLHDAGPRAATLWRRLAIRAVVVIAMMVSIPFADISAGNFVLIYTIPTVVIASLEFLFHHMDRMGFFRSEQTIFTGTDDLDVGDSFEEETVDEQPPRAPEDALSAESQAAAKKAMLNRAFQQRLQRRHCSRLVPVNIPKKGEAKEDGTP